jgi:Ca2+-dependent lipid-binding protein
MEVVVSLINGRCLNAADANGKSDPYVVFTVGETTKKSSKKSSTLNPNWGDNTEFRFPIQFPQQHILQLEAMDSDLIGKNDSLGTGQVDLSHLQPGEQTIVLVRLKGGDKGENLVKRIGSIVDKGLDASGNPAGKVAGSLIDADEDKNHGVLTLALTLLPPNTQPSSHVCF